METRQPLPEGPGFPARPAFWYYDHFRMSLPQRHRYPRSRFALVRERVAGDGLLAGVPLHAAAEADWALLETVHTPGYLADIRAGTLTPAAVREIGLPFTPELVGRARAAVGATVAAARWAVDFGVAGVLGGGTHHAFADRGAGYCLFNDLAVAIKALQREHRAERVAIVDLDVHQGNGSAEVFRHDPHVFTLSIHGEHNWPYRKATSDRDVGLPDGTADEAYLAALAPELAHVFTHFRPDVVFYQAGVDPLHSDRLGRLALTHEGLRQRDRMVLEACEAHHCPLVLTLGGGYGVPLEDSVEAHLNTLRELERVWPARRAAAPAARAIS